jgi:hypothetical protein
MKKKLFFLISILLATAFAIAGFTLIIGSTHKEGVNDNRDWVTVWM